MIELRVHGHRVLVPDDPNDDWHIDNKPTVEEAKRLGKPEPEFLHISLPGRLIVELGQMADMDG